MSKRKQEWLRLEQEWETRKASLLDSSKRRLPWSDEDSRRLIVLRGEFGYGYKGGNGEQTP